MPVLADEIQTRYWSGALEIHSQKMPRDPYPFPKYENDRDFTGVKATQVMRLKYAVIHMLLALTCSSKLGD